ncbi:translation machinery-associated protein 20 [Tulasnella sp. JGI-2019a]|nr:translation machinery-associated protein 20 [Tulasnella sp. JGI-2019a]KAG9004842.1 translation machinery-associated protein 20 [Tulasnella sp. JGI-2019a]
MFKKFSPTSDVSSQSLLKSSIQRGVRSVLLAQYPALAADQGVLLEQIWPKKETASLLKCREHISIYALQGEPLFFQQYDGPLMPSLRLLHKYPDLLPHVQVDRGAIRFLLAGAHMMCPGFTSAGGRLPPKEAGLPAGVAVAIHCEGKEHAAAVGITKLSTEEIKSLNKNVGVELMAFLGDDLWMNPKLS